jgi:hypothetical protein
MKGTLIFLAVAQLADVLATWYALGHGASEVSPLPLAVVALGGWPLALALKVASVPTVGGLLMLAPDEKARRRMLTATRYVAAAVLGVAVLNVAGSL